MKLNRKLISLLLMGALFAAVFSGCGTDSGPSDEAFELPTLTAETFKDYDITMINMFATWCSPCVKELPELQKLSVEMKDRGLQVVGVVLDSVDENGEPSEDGLSKAKQLLESTGVTYPVFAPNFELFDGYMGQIFSVPDTIFVDSEGSIIGGGSVVGARPLSDWQYICEQVIAMYEEQK